MDKEKDILKEFFKEKLQDYTPQVKRDLWSSLESHIPAEKSLWRRIYPAVASVAAVLLIAVASYRYLFNESPDPVEPVSSVIEDKDILKEVVIEEGLIDSELQTNVLEERKTEDIAKVRNSGIKPRIVQLELPEKKENNNTKPDSENEVEQEPPVSESETKQEETDENKVYPPQNEDRKDNLGYNNYYTQVITKKNVGSKTQLSFSGKGFPGMSNNLDYLSIYNTDYLSSYDNKFQIEDLFPAEKDLTEYPIYDGDYSSGNPWYEGDLSSTLPTLPWLPANNYTLKNIKYNIPVALSLYVSREISSHWAIETGISYTKLSSEEVWEAEVSYFDFTATDILTNNIKLDYLGIPLRVLYYPIKNSRLSVYVSGGGMIERCISGKVFTTTENTGKEFNTNLKISELQYSVTGGVGIGLQLIKPVSLFVEPGVIYYFDDGSDIMTIRKDKPFNYNIQGGLRIGF